MNLQASNITATSATVTFGGGQQYSPYGCSTLIYYAYAGGTNVSVPYAMPMQLTGLQPGRTVTVQVINRYYNQFSNSCVSTPATTATVTFTTLAALATAPTAEAGLLTLAPNPARTSATLTLAAPLPAPATVQVLDVLGRELRRLPLPARATTAALDLAGLAPGLYLLRAGAATARLVVE